MKPKQEDSTRRLFWTIYVFDKKISFLLGRSSHMQDSEIDSEPPVASTDLNLQPWDECFLPGIKLARIHGQIHNDLYSVISMKTPVLERSEVIIGRHMDVVQWRGDFHEVSCTSLAIIISQNQN